jgi:hypothetical protein
LPSIAVCPETPETDLVPSQERAKPKITKPKKTKGKSKNGGPSKRETKDLSDFEDSAYASAEEDPDERKGGAKTLPLLLKVSKPCYKANAADDDTEKHRKYARCLASKACKTKWAWPRPRQRILGHAAGCRYLPSHLQDAAAAYLADRASGPPAVIPQIRSRDTISDSDEELGSKLKRTKATSSLSRHATLDVFVEGGRQQARKKLKAEADNALLLFIVCNTLSPNIIDSREFKALTKVLNADYVPASATTLGDTLVPNEAAKVNAAVITHLKGCRNLTITYDGGKIRRPKGFYSVHVTTADSSEYCLDMDDASGLSHTAKYILELLENVSEFSSIHWTASLTLRLVPIHRPSG